MVIYATNNQKACIHILKAQYDLSDEQYKNIMYQNFGCTSSKDLFEEQAERFIHLLNYTFNEDYQRGYTKGMTDMIKSLPLIEQFERKILVKEDRQLTNTEKEMFNLLNPMQQKEFIDKL